MHLVCCGGLDGGREVRVCGRVRLGRRVVRLQSLGSDLAVQICTRGKRLV